MGRIELRIFEYSREKKKEKKKIRNSWSSVCPRGFSGNDFCFDNRRQTDQLHNFVSKFTLYLPYAAEIELASTWYGTRTYS